ncbi:MAG: hypothetical protein QN178_05535 [Armatimonadota bacterium]|nr:hypothetical protein [Armatimonadota bacterium]
MRARLVWMLLVTMVIGEFSGAAIGAAARCTIAEGTGIAGVRIGMPVAAALSVTGPATRQQASGPQIIYTLAAPWAQMVVEGGVVTRITTRSATCRTERGVGPGSTLTEVRQAYASVAISTTTQTPEGLVLAYPFTGIAFSFRNERADMVEVHRADSLSPSGASPRAPAPAGTPPAAAPPEPALPSPTPTTAPGTWGVRSTATRVDNGTLVISGVVENKSRAQSAYAEVQLVGGGHGDAPLQPNPVASGGTATFEVRIPLDRVVQRYTVVIHPLGAPSVVLARAAGEIKDQQQFAAMVARQLQVEVRSVSPIPEPNTFEVVVSNGSPLAVESVTVSVRLTVTCRISGGPGRVLIATAGAIVAAAPPTPPPTPPPPPPTPRTIQETWTGRATVRQIAARSSARAQVQLAGGVCLAFTSWSATTDVSDVRLPQ